MAKVAIHIPTGKKWFIRDTHVDFHTQFGAIPKRELAKKRASTYMSPKQEAFSVLPASPADVFERLKRRAQVILPKDAAMILAYTHANSESVVVDSGSGSGWMTCFLAHYVKHVYSYDIKAEHLETAKKNIATLGLKNVTLKEHDIYNGLPVKPDILHLDVPEPSRVLPHAKDKMKPGSFIVCYTPNLTQNQQTVIAAKELGMLVIDTIEVNIRSWNIDERKIRPLKEEIGPTGFFTILRILTDA